MNRPPQRRRPVPRAAVMPRVANAEHPIVKCTDSQDSSASVEARRPVAMPRPAVARDRLGEPDEQAPRHGPKRVYVALLDDARPVDVQAHQTRFFAGLNEVKALTIIDKKPIRAVSTQSIESLRGYAREDLFAVAEIGYHYIMNGGSRLAVTLFEGLVAIAPDEAYFTLALGLAYDHEGRTDEAILLYEKAAELDPSDPRPDVNRAELLIETRRLVEAETLLRSGITKAERTRDRAVGQKAQAILSRMMTRRTEPVRAQRH